MSNSEIIESGIKRIEEAAIAEKAAETAKVQGLKPEDKPFIPTEERRIAAARELALTIDKKSRTITASYWNAIRGKVDLQMAVAAMASVLASWTTSFSPEEFNEVLKVFSSLTAQQRGGMQQQAMKATIDKSRKAHGIPEQANDA